MLLVLSIACFMVSGLAFTIYSTQDISLMLGLVFAGIGSACLLAFFAKRRRYDAASETKVSGKHWIVAIVTFAIVFSVLYIYPTYIKKSPQQLSREFIEKRYNETAEVIYNKEYDKFFVFFTNEDIKKYIIDISDPTTNTGLYAWENLTNRTNDIVFRAHELFDIDIDLSIVNPLTEVELYTTKNATMTFDIAVGLKLQNISSEDHIEKITQILRESLGNVSPVEVKYDEETKFYVISWDKSKDFLTLTFALTAKSEKTIAKAQTDWGKLKAVFIGLSEETAKIDGTGNLRLKSPLKDNDLLVVSNGTVIFDEFAQE